MGNSTVERIKGSGCTVHPLLYHVKFRMRKGDSQRNILSMKKSILILLTVLISVSAMAQKKAKLALTNAIVIGQLDNPEDRYSLEINLTEMLTSRGIKTIPALNIMKMGADAQMLASDSMQQLIAAKGVDTYLLVSVRGYDRRFKPTTSTDSLSVALSAGNLFNLYQPDITSISFEFKFFRNGQMVYSDIVKCGNISDRETVLKRFRNKVGKRIDKKWSKK